MLEVSGDLTPGGGCLSNDIHPAFYAGIGGIEHLSIADGSRALYNTRLRRLSEA